MKKSVVLFLFLNIFVINFIYATAFAGSDIKTYPQNFWEFNLEAKYFQTTGTYSKSGGAVSSLDGGYSNALTDIEGSFRTILPARNWAIFGEATLSSVEAKSPSATRTNSGLNQAGIGTDYVMYKGDFALIPEFTLTFPFTKNETTTDNAAIGEGATELAARLIAQVNSGRMRYAGWGGYAYRDQGRSALIPYGIAADIRLSYWYFGADLKGYSSTSYDKDTDSDSARISWAKRANGNSLKYFSVNPSLLETNIWAGVQSTQQLGFKFGFGTTLNGTNSAAGMSLNAMLIWRMLTDTKPKSQPFMRMTPTRSTAPKKTPSEIDRFQEQTQDGVDQSLFENEDELYEETIYPNQAPIKNNQLAPPAETKSQPPAKQKRTVKPKRDTLNIQDELDQTEMQIELKKNKSQGN
jgi:hypothetical protein